MCIYIYIYIHTHTHTTCVLYISGVGVGLCYSVGEPGPFCSSTRLKRISLVGASEQAFRTLVFDSPETGSSGFATPSASLIIIRITIIITIIIITIIRSGFATPSASLDRRFP